MARGLLSFLLQNQDGTIQPYASVTVYEADGTTLLQEPLYVGPTGSTTLSNPLTTNDLGRAVAYCDTAQRAVVKTGSGPSIVSTVIDIVDDPADIQSAPIALSALAAPANNLVLTSNGTIISGTSLLNAHIDAAASIAITKLADVGANEVLAGDGSGNVTSLMLTNNNISTSAEIAVSKLADGAAYETILTDSAGTGVAWGASLQSVLTTTGDMPYASAANTPARRAVGATDTVLLVAGGVPTWGTVNTAGITANAVTVRPAVSNGTTNPTTTNTATTALADPTISITLAVVSDVYVWICGLINDGTGGAIIGYHVRINAGAWQDPRASISMPSSSGRGSFSGFHRFPSVAAGGPYLIEVGNSSSTGANTITHYAAGRNMLAIAIAR